ncbi:hypothetical protein LINPERPRIM_LOCUS26371, partial [Linum perenne]
MVDWFAYTIYKLNNGYLIHAMASWPWLSFHPITVDFKSMTITMSTVFNWPVRFTSNRFLVFTLEFAIIVFHQRLTISILWITQMTRTVYSFGAPYIDQQSKPGKPYMLNSLWLMDVIHVYSSTGNQIQIWWGFYLWYYFNNDKKLNFNLSFERELADRDQYMFTMGPIMDRHGDWMYAYFCLCHLNLPQRLDVCYLLTLFSILVFSLAKGSLCSIGCSIVKFTLKRVTGEEEPDKPSRKSKNKCTTGTSDLITGQCQKVFHLAVAADKKNLFCDLLGRTFLNASELTWKCYYAISSFELQ